MNEHRIITGAVTGTTAMTLFSYIVSPIEESNFREPELLAKLAYHLSPTINKNLTRLAGWQLHYIIGFFFVCTYSWLWRQTNLRPNAIAGFLLGGISGIIGISAWKLALWLHPNPPIIKYKKYYKQLLIAHMIFGVFSVIGYNLFNRKRRMKAKPKDASSLSKANNTKQYAIGV